MRMILIGFVLGAMLGLGFETPAGMFVGALVGMNLGLLVHAATWVWGHSGNQPTTERHRLMCIPHGHAADCKLHGDMERGRWLDVRECSLQRDEITCDKSCIALMNDSGIKPGMEAARA